MSSGKSSTRWWMWLAAILGGVGSFVLVTILLDRRRKQRPAPAPRIELKPRPRRVKTQPPARKRVVAKPDDLKAIKGIGPKTAGALQAAGIETFAQLAATNTEQIEAILSDASIRANPATWPEQARLMTGD